MPLAIQPSDFSQRVTDANRDTWTLGTMRYVVKALDGAEVTIVTDTGTGHAVVGTLVNVFNGGPARGPRVTVETEYAPGEFQRTNYWLPKVGIIIEMGDGAGAKWTALNMHREDKDVALRYVRAQFDQEYAWGGKWEMKPSGAGDEVVVSREVKETMEYDFWRVRMDRIVPRVG